MASAVKTIKPARISALKLHSITNAHCYHLRYSHQLATRSQFRNQSTYNPSIESILPHSTASKEQTVNNRVQTVFKTELNDDLIPCYLHDTYWWAYTNPKAVQFWERQWLVDAILWGNFNVLKEEAIKEIHSMNITAEQSRLPSLSVTQIACVYGNFSSDLLSEMMSMEIGQNRECALNYKIIDIAPIQLSNTKRKIDSFLNGLTDQNMDIQSGNMTVGFYQEDSAHLKCIATESEDICYLFFLLHEQPKEVRLKTIAETLRITKTEGKVVIVDYHRPISKWNPFRYIMYPILTKLEPFAIDLWNESVEDYLADLGMNLDVQKTLFFGGLYQKIVVHKL